MLDRAITEDILTIARLIALKHDYLEFGDLFEEHPLSGVL
jgi:hypothetical protein